MKLKAIRKSRKLTQEDVAKILDIPTRTYQNYEREVREPDSVILCKLADFYGVPLDALFGREPTSDRSRSEEHEILNLFYNLNDEGRSKLIDYADDLVSSGKYPRDNS